MHAEARSLSEVTFEVGVSHRKGLNTEDAAVRIISEVASERGGFAVGRALPPEQLSKGECDAIAVLPSGILLLEMKRAAGAVARLQTTSKTTSKLRGNTRDVVPNFSREFKERLDHFRDGLDAFVRAHSLWVGQRPARIPASGVLCFGPTASLKAADDSLPFAACTTRTLRRTVETVIDDGMTGCGDVPTDLVELMRHEARHWKAVGILTVTSKAGFFRSRPLRVVGESVALLGVTEIVCDGGGTMAMHRLGERRPERHRAVGLLVRGRGGAVVVPTTRAFRWRTLAP